MVAARLSKANAEALALQKENEAKTDAQAVLQQTVRKPSMMTNPKGGRQQNVQQAPSSTVSTPPHIPSFVSKRLDLPSQLNENGEEEDFYNCVLPDDVLVELLADRLQV